MITFEITNAEQVVLRMREKSEAIIAALQRRMWEVVILLRDRIVATKLSGQVLKNRTGTLRRSIYTDVQVKGETGGAVVEGTVGVGSKAWYGKVHEYGASVAAVQGKLMRFEINGRVVFSYKRRAFKLPERSFMRSTLRESQGDIRQMLEDALREGLQQ